MMVDIVGKCAAASSCCHSLVVAAFSCWIYCYLFAMMTMAMTLAASSCDAAAMLLSLIWRRRGRG